MNPYAAPFRPMFQVPQQSLPPQSLPPQQQQQGFQQQMMMPQGMPAQQQQSHNILSNELLEKMYSHSNAAALFEVQIGLEQIVYESHEYDTWANAIRDRLTSSDIKSVDVNLAVDIIVEMAVSMNNCQYNFSRLCQFLNIYIHSFALECLVPSLNNFSFCHNSEYSGYLSDQDLQNFVTFLAELYEKIEIKGLRLPQIAALIFEQVNILLNYKPTHDSIVKTVIQVMKLIGRHLEADQNTLPLNAIFGAINELCFNAKELSENVKGQILALNQLRQNEWGVGSNADHASSSNSVSLTHGGNNPTSSILIMGPDGKPLTEEECAFLEENFGFDGSHSPSGSWNEALEDDDVLEDYEKFLQATAIRAAEKALEKLSFEDDEVESIASGSFTASPGNSFATSSPKKTSSATKSSTPSASNIVIVRKEKRKEILSGDVSSLNSLSLTKPNVNEPIDAALKNKQ